MEARTHAGRNWADFAVKDQHVLTPQQADDSDAVS
jgi:hypothetical protein